MMTTLSPRDVRALSVGGMLMLSVLVAGRGVPLLASTIAERRQRAELAMRNVSLSIESAREARDAERELGRLRPQLAALDSALVDANEPSVASARLAELLGDAASSAEARLGTVQLSADTTLSRAGLMHVRARATVSGDLMSIALFLETIEVGPPLLAVRELAISQLQMGPARNQRESLQAEVTVEGLFRPSRIRGR